MFDQVSRAEIASRQNRDSNRREVIRVHHQQRHRDVFARRQPHSRTGGRRRGGRRAVRHARVADGRDLLRSLDQLAIRAIEPFGRAGNVALIAALGSTRRISTLWRKVSVALSVEILQAAHEQSGTDEQQQGQRKLRNRQRCVRGAARESTSFERSSTPASGQSAWPATPARARTGFRWRSTPPR